MLNKNKWTLYLYYSGVLVKKVKIDKDEAPAKNCYVVNTYFKKRLFGSNKAGVILRPIRLLYNDEKNRKTYWGTTFEMGTDQIEDI